MLPETPLTVAAVELGSKNGAFWRYPLRKIISKILFSTFSMQGPTRERWYELCNQAVDEKDPEKLLALVKEINRLLEEKEARLKQPKTGFPDA